jgi:fructose-bisphosphate aldolase class I
MTDQAMRQKIAAGRGFIAALDQSGGSTPKALSQYGLSEDAWSTEDEMFDLIHEMRTRIITAPPFGGERVVGAILFEQTMDRQVQGKPTSHYLWQDKGVVPFLKVDKGLEGEVDGVQMMKPMPDLDALLKRARGLDVYGTKMRSVIGAANRDGIEANIAQQFEVGDQIAAAGLMPILEPEITISIPDKAEAEAMLRDAILSRLDSLPEGREVMLKVTLPEAPNFYKALIDHPKVLKVVALSGGYSREEANAKLAQNTGMIASFSRALTQDLSHGQSDAEFDAALERTIQSIYEASIAG